jgi:hypothetical protein
LKRQTGKYEEHGHSQSDRESIVGDPGAQLRMSKSSVVPVHVGMCRITVRCSVAYRRATKSGDSIGVGSWFAQLFGWLKGPCVSDIAASLLTEALRPGAAKRSLVPVLL